MISRSSNHSTTILDKKLVALVQFQSNFNSFWFILQARVSYYFMHPNKKIDLDQMSRVGSDGLESDGLAQLGVSVAQDYLN